MNTLIIVSSLLIAPLLVSYIYGRFFKKPHLTRLGGIIGLSLSFLFFASGHFFIADKLILMLPEWIPARLLIIHLTGVVEIFIALALLTPQLRFYAGICAIVVLITFFPANIYASIQQLSFSGYAAGLSYLFIRAPLQALLIFWSWYFAVKPIAKKNHS